MGATSSPGPPTTPLEPGMPRLVLWSAILSTGTLPGCRPLLTLPMGSTSSPDPPIALFEFGMLRLILQLASLSRSIHTRSHIHMLLSDLPRVTQRIPVFVQSPTRMVGSRTKRVVYYTGYPTPVVNA